MVTLIKKILKLIESSFLTHSKNYQLSDNFKMMPCTGFEEEYLFQTGQNPNSCKSVSSLLIASNTKTGVWIHKSSEIKMVYSCFYGRNFTLENINSFFENCNSKMVSREFIYKFLKSSEISMLSKLRFILYLDLSSIFGWSSMHCLLKSLKVNYKISFLKGLNSVILIDKCFIVSHEPMVFSKYSKEFCIIPSSRAISNIFIENPGRFFWIENNKKKLDFTKFQSFIKSLDKNFDGTSIPVWFFYNFVALNKSKMQTNDWMPSYSSYIFEIYAKRVEELDIESEWSSSLSFSHVSIVTRCLINFVKFLAFVTYNFLAVIFFLGIELFCGFICVVWGLTCFLFVLLLLFWLYLVYNFIFHSDETLNFSTFNNNYSSSSVEMLDTLEYAYIMNSPIPIHYKSSIRLLTIPRELILHPVNLNSNSLQISWWANRKYGFDALPGFYYPRIITSHFEFNPIDNVWTARISFAKTYNPEFSNFSGTNNQLLLNSADILANPKRLDCLNGNLNNLNWKVQSDHYDIGLEEMYFNCVSGKIDVISNFKKNNPEVIQIGLLRESNQCLISKIGNPRSSIIGCRSFNEDFINSNIRNELYAYNKKEEMDLFMDHVVEKTIPHILSKIETGDIRCFEVIN